MKLLVVSNWNSKNPQYDEFIVDHVEFLDQTNIKNGMWLICKNGDQEFSIEFNPRKDLFEITE